MLLRYEMNQVGYSRGHDVALVQASGLYPLTSRLNHSCAPNAWANWNSRTQRMTVHALGALPAGEEVRVDYRGADGETPAHGQKRWPEEWEVEQEYE